MNDYFYWPPFLIRGYGTFKGNGVLVIVFTSSFCMTGSSLMVPCLTALASCHGAASHKGTLLGIWRSLGALARAIGPIVTSVGKLPCQNGIENYLIIMRSSYIGSRSTILNLHTCIHYRIYCLHSFLMFPTSSALRMWVKGIMSTGFWSLGAEWCYVLGGLSMALPWLMLQSY